MGAIHAITPAIEPKISPCVVGPKIIYFAMKRAILIGFELIYTKLPKVVLLVEFHYLCVF